MATVKTIDGLRSALHKLGGERCRIIAACNVYESHNPGSRYESVSWSGSVEAFEREDCQLFDVTVSAKSPDEVLLKIKVAIRDALAKRARQRSLDRDAIRVTDQRPKGYLAFTPVGHE